MDKKVHLANVKVKMSQEMKVFSRLLIITSLKKHTIFIVATLLKYSECREFHFAFYVIIKLIQNRSHILRTSTHAAFIGQ
jgi:hypothetical protein